MALQTPLVEAGGFNLKARFLERGRCSRKYSLYPDVSRRILCRDRGGPGLRSTSMLVIDDMCTRTPSEGGHPT